MKKTLLSLFLLTSLFTAKAQISGVPAPDFTVTDINGVTHTLSDYIAQGKTVIMDVSATWCGPCWSFHQTKALDDLYNSYGANGSDEVVVIFVEGDPQTTLDDLNGTGTNTRGDWVTGVDYPIVDDDGTINNLYDVQFFPTLFRICPDGIVTNISTGGAAALRNNINANCGVMTGALNHARVTLNTLNTCTTTARPVARLKNYGTNQVNNVVLQLKENGTVVGTKTLTSIMNAYGNGTVTFDPITINPTSTYTTDIVSINTLPPYNNLMTNAELEFNLANEATTDIEVRVYTDNYPTEITWRIKNGAGTVIVSGGPYVGNPNGGGQDANTTMIHTATIPNVDDCFSLELNDSYGDGWGFGSTPHGVEIFSGGNSILDFPVGSFGTAITRAAAFKSVQTLGLIESEKSKISILPNPSNGIFTVTTEEPVAVSIYDITGKIVYTAKELNNDASINLSSYNKGIYLAKVTGLGFTNTVKLIIK
jgi:thiol-disulfide isomerase/thioredoxin